MTRSPRAEIRSLKDEAQGLELLASEADIEFSRLEDYWALSLELVALVIDIDAYAIQFPEAAGDDSGVTALRHRLRDLSDRLAGMTAE